MNIVPMVMLAVISANYGVLVNLRDTLESATRDAGRILMRAPAAVTIGANGLTAPTPYPTFIEDAEALIASRLGVDVGKVTVETEALQLAGSEYLANKAYYTMKVEATVEVDHLSLVENLMGPITLTARERGRWYNAGHEPGHTGCLLSERRAGNTEERCR
ncbi:MAG: hypothetical protein ACFBWO_09090 [Paracoccaceae bacterium]